MYKGILYFVFITLISANINAIDFKHNTSENKEVLLISGATIMSLTDSELIPIASQSDEDFVYWLVDEYPTMQHNKGLREHTQSLITYPEEAIKNHIEGVVLVNLIVEKDGKISNPRIVRGIGYGCEEAVLSALENFPLMKPGKISGKAVRVSFTLPVKFQLKY